MTQAKLGCGQPGTSGGVRLRFARRGGSPHGLQNLAAARKDRRARKKEMRGLLLVTCATATGRSSLLHCYGTPLLRASANWLNSERGLIPVACRKIRADVLWRTMGIPPEASDQSETLLQDRALCGPDQAHGQVAHVASLEALVSLPDSEDAEEIEFEHVVSAADHLYCRLQEKKRQLWDQGDLHAFKEVDARCKESWATLVPLLDEQQERAYASMSDQKLADYYRRDDEALGQLMDTFWTLRDQGRHLAADEVKEELNRMMERRDAFEDRIMQEKGDLEGLARVREFRKDGDACVPRGTTACLERAFVKKERRRCTPGLHRDLGDASCSGRL